MPEETTVEAVTQSNQAPTTMGDSEARSNIEVERDKADGLDMPQGFDPSAFEQAQRNDKGTGGPEPRTARTEQVESTSDGKPTTEAENPLDWKPKKAQAAQYFHDLKTTVKELKAENESLKSGRVPESSSDHVSEDIAALRKERDEYRDLIRKTRIEHDPEFNSRFDVRKKSVIESAVAASGEKASEMEKLLKQPSSYYRDEQIAALMDDIPDGGKRRINGALDILDRLELERKSEIDAAAQNWDSNQSRIADDQRMQQEAESSQVSESFDKTVSAWKGKGDNAHFLYQPDEGDPEAVDRQIQSAQNILKGGLSVDDRVKAALIISSYPRFTKEFQSVVTERNSLRSQIEKLQGVQPGAGSSVGMNTPSKKGPAYGDDAYENSFVDALTAARGQDVG